MPILVIVSMWAALAVALNRAHYAKPAPIEVTAGYTLIMSEDGERLGLVPTEPDVELPPWPEAGK